MECKKAASRIKYGIKTLKNNNFILNCFRFTNHAMYLQQVHWGLNAEDQYNKSEINKFVKAKRKKQDKEDGGHFSLHFF